MGQLFILGHFLSQKSLFLTIFGHFNFFKFNIARITIILSFLKSLVRQHFLKKIFQSFFIFGVRRGRKTLKCEIRIKRFQF